MAGVSTAALHLSPSPERMRTASMTMSPATMALVVAIAWMMFPAMPLQSKTLIGLMP